MPYCVSEFTALDTDRSNLPKGPDQQRRIEKLKERLAEMAGGEGEMYCAEGLDPDIEESFLRSIIRMEEAEWTSPMDQVRKGGLEPAASKDVSDDELNAKLHELVQVMASRNMFVYNTDHLSDRELYEFLVEQVLPEPGSFMGSEEPGPGFSFMIDVLGGFSNEDVDNSFRYYTHDDDERRRWMEHFPDYVMPPKVKPPYDRDRFLPHPEGLQPPDDSDDDGPVM